MKKRLNNRVGEIFSSLSHHRTCRSAYGGSIMFPSLIQFDHVLNLLIFPLGEGSNRKNEILRLTVCTSRRILYFNLRPVLKCKNNFFPAVDRHSLSVPYGYLRDPKDKQHLIIDEEAAKVVRRIYQMTVEEHGKRDIARALTVDKILIPAAYAAEHCPENNPSHGYACPYEWSCTAISYILEKQEYIGHTVLGKTVTDNFKTKKRRKAKPEELMIFQNTHDAIIDEETWHNAQRLKRTVRREVKNGTYKNRLTGLLYCADCGAKLTYRSPSAQHRPTEKPMTATTPLYAAVTKVYIGTAPCTISRCRWLRN